MGAHNHMRYEMNSDSVNKYHNIQGSMIMPQAQDLL